MRISFILISMFLLLPRALAQIAIGPTASGAGNAGVASVDRGEASWLNPAALTQMQGYYFSASGSVADHAVDGNQKHYTLMAADNETDQLMAGSFTYVHRNIGRSQSEGGNVYNQDMQLALAGPVAHGLSVGVGLHRLSTVWDGPTGTQTNASIGFLWTPNNALGLGIVMYDFAGVNDALPVDLRLRPTLALGANWIAKDFIHVRFDLSHPTQSFRGQASDRTDIMTGFETFVDPEFAFRFGVNWKETSDQTWFTTGLGFLGPRLSIDYAFQKDVRQANGYRHLIDLWMRL